MANQLCKGHQAVLVTLKGLRHRVHIATFHHPGDAVSGACLREMVEADALVAERDTLLNWLAQLEVDNATCPNPVHIRWLLDGGFGDAPHMTYLIEMGYDVYTMAHNGKTTQALLKAIPTDAHWTQA